MNRKEFEECQQGNVSALFKITSNCNDYCTFCIERGNINKGIDNLSFVEIKNNFEYLRNKFNLDYVIITGGEPTLHPDFLKILDYFYNQEIQFRVITNLLMFSNIKFFKKVLPYFLPNNRPSLQRDENKIIGSINDLPKNKISQKRIIGLKNLLKNNLNIMLITVIYKDNLESLSELISYLYRLFKKYHYNKPVNLELRLIYVRDTLKSLLKISLPTNFQKIKESIQRAIRLADSLGITITLWNFPLCYLDNVPKFKDKNIQKRREKKLLKISKMYQLEGIQVRDFLEYFKKSRACLNCKYKEFCSGIEDIYLKKYCFPTFKPFK